MGSEPAVNVWRHLTPQWAQRSARRWLTAGIAVYGIRLIAYTVLNEEQWRFADAVLGEGVAWICFALFTWRRGFLAGWDTMTEHETMTKTSPT